MGGDPKRVRSQVQERAHDAAEVHVPAAEAGEVDVIAAYTSDGRIARMTSSCWTTEGDPPYDAIVLVAPKTRE